MELHLYTPNTNWWNNQSREPIKFISLLKHEQPTEEITDLILHYTQKKIVG